MPLTYFKYVQLNGGIRRLRRKAAEKKSTPKMKTTPFMQYLQLKLGEGTMNAREITEVAWHVWQLGHPEFKALAVNPKSKHKGKNAARTIERCFGLGFIWNHYIMQARIPCRNKKKATLQPVAICPVYEPLARMFKQNKQKFMSHVNKPDLLLDNFYKHPTVLAHGAENCFPLRLFLDFGRLDNRQTVLNITISSPFINMKIPFGSFHKRLFCRCGCRGAHTFQPLIDVLAWIFRVIAGGRWPSKDYYEKPFPESSWRSMKAGKFLFEGKIGVLSEICPDLDEAAKTLGLPDYRSNFGCKECFKRKSELSDLRPCKRRKHAWLVDSATDGLTLHTCSNELALAMKQNCKPQYARAGVCLTCDLSPALQCNDRLEPACGDLVDFWHDESVEPTNPSKMLTYRRRKNGPMYISRLFEVPGIQQGVPGLTKDNVLFDSMHCVELGFVEYYNGKAIQALGRAGMFGDKREKDEMEETMRNSFSKYHKVGTKTGRVRIPNFDLNVVIDTQNTPVLGKPKAHESKAILHWLVDVLKNKGGAQLLDDDDDDDDSTASELGTHLLQCGSGLCEWYQILSEEPRKVSEDALQKLEDVVEKTIQAWKKCSSVLTMKMHIFHAHLVDQMRWAGNVTWTHNYLDETENYYTRLTGQSCNRAQYSKRYLMKWYLKFLTNCADGDNDHDDF